ncbi:MAG: hypothetical protein FWG30_00125 [Eubacteriaceae bacterium]|nr:hypothetical protein [Eubacteriaceae bacterium]
MQNICWLDEAPAVRDDSTAVYALASARDEKKGMPATLAMAVLLAPVASLMAYTAAFEADRYRIKRKHSAYISHRKRKLSRAGPAEDAKIKAPLWQPPRLAFSDGKAQWHGYCFLLEIVLLPPSTLKMAAL